MVIINKICQIVFKNLNTNILSKRNFLTQFKYLSQKTYFKNLRNCRNFSVFSSENPQKIESSKVLVLLKRNLNLFGVAAKKIDMGFETSLNVYDFKFSCAELEERASRLIADQKVVYDDIAALPLDRVDFQNTIKAISDSVCVLQDVGRPLSFVQSVALDKDLRDSSCAAEKKLDQFKVEISMRKDVFDRIVAFNEKVGLENLDDEQKRFVEKLIKIGRRNGLHLSEEIRSEIETIKSRMSDIGIMFSRNLNEENTKIYFTKEQLRGMTDDYINELKVVDGKYEVTLKYPHLYPLTKKCKIAQTRKTMITANHCKCIGENTPILQELIELRQRHASLLGYKNHAAYIQEERMAENPKNVATFLADLAVKLKLLWEDELKVLYDLKKKECDEFGFEDSGKIEFWDTSYYMNMVEETIYHVDEEKIREYFPLEKVTSGMFEIYQRILSVKFELIQDFKAWHPEVKLFSVCDKGTGELMGYFFMDLHPREGKYGHACVHPLRTSCINPKGVRQTSVSAMLCNFTKPTKEKPALLTHSEVETYFHEFGHAMHTMCGRVNMAHYDLYEVERDFIEAPSQMLENWCWESESLRMMSEHYKTMEQMPDEMIEKLVASRKVNAGGFNLRQIALSTFDQKIHSAEKEIPKDTSEVFAKTYREVVGLTPINGTNMPASFNHMVGYDAQYYGYLWSEVFAQDMFESRFKNALLSPEVGMVYRLKILRPLATKDAKSMLLDFLGREPTADAFLRSKGIEVN